ncbi:type II toxin-antitoxin system prevent-host-death family antitoxin [Paracoccus liaowanqingii]|uniref:Antitoxin n=1 Tax=Paracoccus liaowanqingii TaxID=2560053 RepID=A0A4Z1C929_9RHOB|nr:type II toxin-antitoxin system prevent-host-death family antitoxin [Paracoccus liaowanqingii]TGN39679.1 type II toxin-antitoxin system prevent-host-death family antitoxin [Paracoccus liaowanqingii]
MQIAIAEAKAQFAELIRRVEAGEEVELTRYGRPVARLTAAQTPGQGLIGCMRGRFVAPGAVDEADEAVAALFADSRIPLA